MSTNNHESTEHVLRQQIYSTLRSTPGLHIREISRHLNIPYSSLKYHLNCLEKQGAIQTERVGKFLYYYTDDSLGTKEKELLMILRSTTAKQIILSVLIQGYVSQIDLSRQLGKHPTTIAEVMKKLVLLDVVTSVKASDVTRITETGLMDVGFHLGRNERFFLLKDPALVSSVVRLYPERFCTDDVSTGLVRRLMKREGAVEVDDK
jgi:predicted ArsR family transcriptional regulator